MVIRIFTKGFVGIPKNKTTKEEKARDAKKKNHRPFGEYG
jgi:hypothetical protein